MSAYVDRAGLKIATVLADFVENKAVLGTGLAADRIWSGLADLLARFVPVNRALLDVREDLQTKIDAWHQSNPGPIGDMAGYTSFLRDIGYLVAEPDPFSIGTKNVDPEIASMAGPQSGFGDFMPPGTISIFCAHGMHSRLPSVNALTRSCSTRRGMSCSANSSRAVRTPGPGQNRDLARRWRGLRNTSSGRNWRMAPNVRLR